MKRLTIAEAARELGVTQDVIKRRITKRELVACQAPEYRECVWIQESSVPISTSSPVIDQQKVDMVKEEIEKEEIEEVDRPPEAPGLLELKRQLEDIQKRIKELESIDAGSTPMSKE